MAMVAQPSDTHSQPGSEYVLYRWWSSDGCLLYVGQSVRLWSRVSQRRHGSRFFMEAAAMTLERLPTRAALDEAERLAIQAEHPVYNITHNQTPGSRPRKVDPRSLVIHEAWVDTPLEDLRIG